VSRCHTNKQVSDALATYHVDDAEEDRCWQGVVVGYGTNRSHRWWWWNGRRRQGMVVGHNTDRPHVRGKETDASNINQESNVGHVSDRRVDGDDVTDVDYK